MVFPNNVDEYLKQTRHIIRHVRNADHASVQCCSNPEFYFKIISVNDEI